MRKDDDNNKRVESVIQIEPASKGQRKYALNDTMIESNDLTMIKDEHGE